MKNIPVELTRKEIHQKLKGFFGVNSIHSEYGMTELLSQDILSKMEFLKILRG